MERDKERHEYSEVHEILGLQTEEQREAFRRLRELGAEKPPQQEYIYPLWNNTDTPLLGGSYVAKLERDT